MTYNREIPIASSGYRPPKKPGDEDQAYYSVLKPEHGKREKQLPYGRDSSARPSEPVPTVKDSSIGVEGYRKISAVVEVKARVEVAKRARLRKVDT